MENPEKSWKILESFVVMESQGKVREFGKFVKSHGKGILVMEKSWNCIYLLAMAAFQFVVSRNSHTRDHTPTLLCSTLS